MATRLAPSSANRSAIALPIPRDPPVTSTEAPSKLVTVLAGRVRGLALDTARRDSLAARLSGRVPRAGPRGPDPGHVSNGHVARGSGWSAGAELGISFHPGRVRGSRGPSSAREDA